MKNQTILRGLIGAVALSLASASFAQSLQLIQESKDWSVFKDQGNGKHCYIVSKPVSQKAMKDGAEVQVDRGDALLYVGVKNGVTEPSFKAGYPLAGDKAVAVKIGGQNFKYYITPTADAQFAWPQPTEDEGIVNAMKAGSTVEITANSQRGTTTVDNFSLSGFTAAFNAARDNCK